jgi:putative GTP pyrophosphokinase
VLNQEFSVQYDRNPIESIKSRIKEPRSILEKLMRNDKPISIESLEENLNDVAGVRVICGFPGDIYRLAAAFLSQDDVTLIEKKDYIENPKRNGYRSLHLIVTVPIFLHDEKKLMRVEVQFRTIAMDWWASLEHQIRYKKEVTVSNDEAKELRDCAEQAALLDYRMEQLYKSIQGADA